MLLNLNQEITINWAKTVKVTLIIIVALAIISLAVVCFLQSQEIKQIRKELDAHQTNAKIVSFLDTFIKKVLEAQGEVSFEDRLKLENAIRDINDPKLLTLWENFTQAKTSAEVQTNVKDLLDGLVSKITN